MQAKRLKNGNIEIRNCRVITQDRLREMEKSLNPAEQLEALWINEALNKKRITKLTCPVHK